MARYLLIVLVLALSLAVCKCQNTGVRGVPGLPGLQGTGSCPPLLPVDICEATCESTSPCANPAQLCCPTACGGAMCVDAMTQRQFVYLVKKGRCPDYPRGPWVCTNTCTGDSDCPRVLKCCPNRCGALTCQKPQDEDVLPPA